MPSHPAYGSDGSTATPPNPLYDRFVRPLLPLVSCNLSGVTVRGPARLFESNREYPQYKQCLCDAIRTHVSDGDLVNIVGGGLGVSAVLAARQGGDVFVYEASAHQHDMIQQTLGLNEHTDDVDVINAVIGAYGNDAQYHTEFDGDAPQLAPTTVDDCDVLVLNCDGVEALIISEMSPTPTTIIVEYHAYQQSPRSRIESLLEHTGYDIVGDCKYPEYDQRGTGVFVAERK